MYGQELDIDFDVLDDRIIDPWEHIKGVKPVIFDITNIQKWLVEHSGKPPELPDDLFGMIPPFKYCRFFYEGYHVGRRVIFDIGSVCLDLENGYQYPDHFAEEEGAETWPEEARWWLSVELRLLILQGSQLLSSDLLGATSYYLDRNGDQTSDNSFTHVSDYGEQVFSFFRESNPNHDSPSAFIYSLVWPALVSIFLLNIRNIETFEPKVTRQMRRQAERKKRKFLKYKTINIQPFMSRPHYESHEKTGRKNRFHICRGHFAHYTEDKPLFGNPKLVGKFWHPAHLKGNKSKGVIVKDYEIDEPELDTDTR